MTPEEFMTLYGLTLTLVNPFYDYDNHRMVYTIQIQRGERIALCGNYRPGPFRKLGPACVFAEFCVFMQDASFRFENPWEALAFKKVLGDKVAWRDFLYEVYIEDEECTQIGEPHVYR